MSTHQNPLREEYLALMDAKEYDRLIEMLRADYRAARGGMSWWTRWKARRQVETVVLGCRMLQHLSSEES